MKFIKSFITLSLFFARPSLAAGDNCQDPYTGQKDRATLEGKFCACAPTYLNSVQAPSIVEEKKVIDELMAKKSLIENVEKMRDQYLKAFRDLNDKEKDLSPFNKFKNYQTAIVNGAVLKSLNVFFKQNHKELLKPDFNISKLCETNFEGKDFICALKKQFNILGLASIQFDNSLKNFIAAYNLATSNGSNDPDSLNEAISNILSTIPKDLNPDIILSHVKNTDPKLFAQIEALKNRNHPLVNSVENEKLISALTNFPLTDNPVDFKLIPNFENAIQNTIKTTMTNIFQSDIKDQSLPEKFAQGIDELAFKLGDDFNLIKSACGSASLNNQTNFSKMYDCFSKLDTFFTGLTGNQTLQEIEQLIADKQTDLKSKLDKEKAAEKNAFTTYLLTKFDRKCGPLKEKKTRPPSPCNEEDSSIVKSYELQNMTYQIVGELETKSDNAQSLFSREEIKKYTVHCQESTKKQFEYICLNIQNDSQIAQETKTKSEWKAFNERYYPVYPNPTNPKEVKYVERPSKTLAVMGALGNSFHQLWPTLLNNYQFNQGIDNMTNQALMQKQWMDWNQTYSSSLNNLWMQAPLFPPMQSMQVGIPANSRIFSGF